MRYYSKSCALIVKISETKEECEVKIKLMPSYNVIRKIWKIKVKLFLKI